MKMSATTKGFNQLRARLKKDKVQKVKRLSQNLLRAGLYLQRESQRLVPVEYGVLRNSAFTRREDTGRKFIVLVGYTAAYAIYVHEIPPYPYKTKKGKLRSGAKHRAPTGWKYLERPYREKHKQLMKIVQDGL